MSEYVPDAGDLVWLSFSPQSGREQAGRRPAIVVSPKTYNSVVGLMLACPITSKVKGYPFEVVLADNLPVSGAILSDHLRSLDWRARSAEYIATADKKVINTVRHRLLLLIEPSS